MEQQKTLELECPGCGKAVEVTVEDIGSEVACKGCGAPIDLKDIGLGPALEDAGGRMKEMFGKMF